MTATDYNMPAMTDPDVALEPLAIQPGLPVIITSVYVTKALLASFVRIGGGKVIEKSGTTEQMVVQITIELAV